MKKPRRRFTCRCDKGQRRQILGLVALTTKDLERKPGIWDTIGLDSMNLSVRIHTFGWKMPISVMCVLFLSMYYNNANASEGQTVLSSPDKGNFSNKFPLDASNVRGLLRNPCPIPATAAAACSAVTSLPGLCPSLFCLTPVEAQRFDWLTIQDSSSSTPSSFIVFA